MGQFVYLYHIDPVARHQAMGTPEAAQKSMQLWMKWMADLDAA